jgi:hypothetical protein
MGNCAGTASPAGTSNAHETNMRVVGDEMRVRQMAGAIMVVALAGCGTATALPTAGHRTGHRGGPPSGTRAESLRLARKLMARNILPPSARRLPQHPVPPGLRQVALQDGVKSSVDIYRLFAVPASMRQTAAYIGKHAPAGMKPGGSGSTGGRDGITEMDVSYFLNRSPKGISSAGLSDTIVPAPHGGALLRVDVQVIWYPPRSAAEYLAVKDYRAVQIDAWLSLSGRHVRRTFTSHAILGKLTRLLNGLPASPGGIFPCPLATVSYQLTFEPAPGHPKAVVNTSGCAFDTISVGGATAPSLADFGQLATLAGKIMHIHPSLRRQGPPRAG